ncbi:MAG: DUF58 domain-containing protein [Acidobacteria bacterium]|nr:DUF58 domain-containing protein [Acidobacteriota bacterium]MDA1236521.1 DUF58 domain-containing protein [Acidobacteriota bacterium]
MISKDLAKKIRLIQIHSRRAVNDVLAGEYHSVFKGRGMEFDEVREYAPGDEIRSIDWNVTARMGKPFIKRYVEERELTVLLIVDLSASGDFGSKAQRKNEVAAELCALLSFSAIRNNDKVGLIAFTDRVEKFIPPKKGSTHVMRLVTDLLQFKPQGKGTNLTAALEYAGRITHRKSIIFIVSDFLDSCYDKPLKVLSRRHDVVAVSVNDPHEAELPNVGLIELTDAETGQRRIFDSSAPSVRKRFKALAMERNKSLESSFRQLSIDQIRVTAGEDYLLDLISFFRRRERRL